MNDELLPCPFCGSKDLWRRSVLERNPITRNERKIFHVECGTCGGRTTIFSTADKASNAWNQRATGEVSK